VALISFSLEILGGSGWITGFGKLHSWIRRFEIYSKKNREMMIFASFHLMLKYDLA